MWSISRAQTHHCERSELSCRAGAHTRTQTHTHPSQLLVLLLQLWLQLSKPLLNVAMPLLSLQGETHAHPSTSIIKIRAYSDYCLSKKEKSQLLHVCVTLERAATLCASSASTSGSVSAFLMVWANLCSANSSISCSWRTFSSLWHMRNGCDKKGETPFLSQQRCS